MTDDALLSDLESPWRRRGRSFGEQVAAIVAHPHQRIPLDRQIRQHPLLVGTVAVVPHQFGGSLLVHPGRASRTVHSSPHTLEMLRRHMLIQDRLGNAIGFLLPVCYCSAIVQPGRDAVFVRRDAEQKSALHKSLDLT